MSEKVRIQIKDAYASTAQKTARLDKSNLQWLVIAEVLSQLPKEAKILDIACGNGKYSQEIMKMGFTNVHSVDLFDYVGGIEINYEKAEFNTLPYQDDYFDFCFSISAIYYSEDIKKTLLEWQRVLNKNGILFFSGHTKYSMFTAIRILKKVFLPKRFPHLVNAHFYSPLKIRSVAHSVGFKTISSSGFFISWMDRFTRTKLVSSVLNRVAPARIKFLYGYHFTLLLSNK